MIELLAGVQPLAIALPVHDAVTLKVPGPVPEFCTVNAADALALAVMPVELPLSGETAIAGVPGTVEISTHPLSIAVASLLTQLASEILPLVLYPPERYVTLTAAESPGLSGSDVVLGSQSPPLAAAPEQDGTTVYVVAMVPGFRT